MIEVVVDSALIQELAHKMRPQIAFVELTTNCNMRCIYCSTSRPYFSPQTLKYRPAIIVQAIKDLFDTSVRIQLSGHGETTMLPWWTEIAEPLLDSGYLLCLITNMKRKFTEHEVDILSRFVSISISCETSDPVMHRKIRRGGNLGNLVDNIRRIKNKGTAVHLTLSAVCHNVFLDDALTFLDWAIDLGVKSMVVCNMDVLPILQEICWVDKPDMTVPENASKLKALYHRANELGFPIEFQGLLKDVIDDQ